MHTAPPLRAPAGPSLRSLVLVPAVLTLLVTLLRLAGELRGWDPRWFSTAPGGGRAWLGIVGLVPCCGAWFGWRLARSGHRPSRAGKALLLQALSVLAYALTFVLVHAVLRPDATTRAGLQLQLLAMGAGCLLSAVPGLLAWPALFRANAVYGLLARLPIVAITYLAVAMDWGTHYEKLGPKDYSGFTPLLRASWLAFAQLAFWPPFQVALGGLCGLLVALAIGTRRAAPS